MSQSQQVNFRKLTLTRVKGAWGEISANEIVSRIRKASTKATKLQSFCIEKKVRTYCFNANYSKRGLISMLP